MKTQYYTATSLDGFIATEDDSLEWLFPLGDIADTSYPAFIAQVGALAMGSFALGALAIGRLWIGRAHIRKLRIDELEVGRIVQIGSRE